MLAVGPHVCEISQRVIQKIGTKSHVSCFDVTPGVVDHLMKNGVAFTHDQQPRLQSYLPIVYLRQYNRFGLMPYGDTLTAPAFVCKENAPLFKEFAGINRVL